MAHSKGHASYARKLSPPRSLQAGLCQPPPPLSAICGGPNMSKQEVKRFFDDYVFGFIFSDIKREIALARSGIEIPGEAQKTYKGGANFLCALGLLCYTEFMGGIYKGSFKKFSSKTRFNAFFDLMGPDYQAFDKQLVKKGLSVYKVFRCGMVHEYLERRCAIAMLSGDVRVGVPLGGPLSLSLVPTLHVSASLQAGPVQYGIGFLYGDKQYEYFFVVEQYFKDFANACRTVYNQLMKLPNPQIPSPRI